MYGYLSPMIDELGRIQNCRKYADTSNVGADIVSVALEAVGVDQNMQEEYLGPFSEQHEPIYSTDQYNWKMSGKVFRAEVYGWHEKRANSIMARVGGHPELAYHSSSLQPIASVLHNSLKIGPMASSNGSGRQYRIYCEGADRRHNALQHYLVFHQVETVNPALLFAVEYELLVDRKPPETYSLTVRGQWITKEADHAIRAVRVYVVNFFDVLTKEHRGKYNVHIGSICNCRCMPERIEEINN